LDVIQTADSMADAVATLTTLAREGEQIGMDVTALQSQISALFDIKTAPSNMRDLSARVEGIRTFMCEVTTYRWRINLLVRTLDKTLSDVNALLDTVSGIAGQKQSMQVLSQQMSQLVYVASLQTTQQAADRQEAVYVVMQDQLVRESLRLIRIEQRKDWP